MLKQYNSRPWDTFNVCFELEALHACYKYPDFSWFVCLWKTTFKCDAETRNKVSYCILWLSELCGGGPPCWAPCDVSLNLALYSHERHFKRKSKCVSGECLLLGSLLAQSLSWLHVIWQSHSKEWWEYRTTEGNLIAGWCLSPGHPVSSFWSVNTEWSSLEDDVYLPAQEPFFLHYCLLKTEKALDGCVRQEDGSVGRLGLSCEPSGAFHHLWAVFK